MSTGAEGPGRYSDETAETLGLNEVDLYADENAPYVKQTSKVYIVRYPRPAEMKWDERYALYVEVGLETRELHVQPHSMYLGKTFKNMEHSEQMEVYSFLCEWELAVWQRIGPEDSELFATNKLIEQGERYMDSAPVEGLF